MPDDMPGPEGLTPRAETRGDQRQRMLKGGAILGDDGSERATCLIRNLSATGARLEVQNGAPVPDRFVLAMPEGHRRPVQTAWSSGPHCGVKFRDLDPDLDRGGPAARMLARIEAIEDQLADLRDDMILHLKD